jgi:hypothetical protein
MAEGKSSPEAWDAYTQLWQTYYRFTPQNDREKAWYTQSLTRLNELGDQRRLRLLSSQSGGVPWAMWGVLIGAGAITIGFSLFFGTKNTVAQVLMTCDDYCTGAALDPGAGTALCWDHPYRA